MRILVFGAGAVGSLLGGFLARLGHDVALLGRAWHLGPIGKRGLAIKGLWGEYHIRTFDLYASTAEIPSKKRPFDLVLLTVKSFDTEKAAVLIPPLLHEGSVLLSFQNGLTNIETILRHVPAAQFVPGRIITGVEIVPGEVTVTVSADDLVLGALPGTSPVVLSETIARLFRSARVPARSVPDILNHIWLKAIYNCALNAPCSILGIPYGRILETEEGRASVKAVVEECYAVARAKQVELCPSDAAGYHELLIKKLIPVTATHYPSMIRDIEKGRRTEIDALNGAVCRWGKELKIPTPENQRIVDLICLK